MSIELILLIPIILLPICFILTLYLAQEPYKKLYIHIFFLGALGWLLAVLARIIPLQLVQILILSLLGVDINNSDEIAAHANDFLLLFWGPLFAGIFEEIGRYLLYRRSEFIRKNDQRVRTTIIFGLGWSASEIVFIFVVNYFTYLFTEPNLAISIESLIPGFIERITSTFIHVSLSMMVIYALFEIPWTKKYSLWIAILIHFAIDLTIILLNLGLNVWIFEIGVLVIAICLFVLIFKIYVPSKERKLQEGVY